MPELPEVETIRRGLASRLLGQKVRQISVLEAKSWQVPVEGEMQLVGHQILAVNRRAKLLMVSFDSGYSLLTHLKMTGQLIFREKKTGQSFGGGHPTASLEEGHSLPDRSTRLIFDFDSGTRLYFNDQRKFGWMKLVATEDIPQETFIAGLGPEIVDFTQAKISEQIDEAVYRDFISRVRHHAKAPIKAVILDQKVIAGIGNIYADEGLWGAQIYPGKPTGQLSDDQLRQLLEQVRAVMARSINSGGSTMKNYVRADGSKGSYLELFASVFRREGLPCPRCGTTIVKVKLASRGTHFCPNCQKDKV